MCCEVLFCGCLREGGGRNPTFGSRVHIVGKGIHLGWIKEVKVEGGLRGPQLNIPEKPKSSGNY